MPGAAQSSPAALLAPDSFSGTGLSNSQIGLSWAASSGASGYKLYEMENGQPVLINTYSSSATSATVSGLTPATTYQFSLAAFNRNATAATPWISATTGGGVSAPGDFTGIAASTTQIGLSWTASSGATGYSLYEMENGQPVLVNTYSSSTTSATINWLAPGSTYQFNLVAFNANATSATAWVSATTAGGVSAPANFTGTATSTTQIGVSWSASGGASGYRLYEMESGQPVLINTYSPSTTSATVSGLTPATTYQFNLVAFNANATAATAWVSATTGGGVSEPANFAGARYRPLKSD